MFLKQKIIISEISEASCGTEDWSNDAEHSALNHRNKYNFKTFKEKSIFINSNTISTV